MLEAPQLVLLMTAVVGLAQVAFLTLLLRHEGKRAFRANRWLVVFALAAGISFIEDIIDVVGMPQMTLYMAPVFLAAIFCFVPAIYLYFREIADRAPKRPVLHFVIIGPVVVAVTFVVLTLHRDFSPLPMDGGEIDIEVSTEEHLVLAIVLLGVFVTLYAQLFAYMPKVWKVALAYLRSAEQQLGADQKVLRRWVRELVIGVTAIFVVFTAATLIDMFITESAWLDVFVQGSFALVFFKLSHTMALNPTLFVQADWDEAGVQGAEPSDGRSDQTAVSQVMSFPDASTNTDGFSDRAANAFVCAEDAAKITTRLDKVIADTDVLFDPLLSMPKLASLVGTKPNQLSFVLNRHIGKSFFDFINEARTRQASDLLVAHPDRTILDIATEVGFNSKSTFNLAFKKITGLTPSAYRRENGI
jgi:AraC-like DNA-binding protein